MAGDDDPRPGRRRARAAWRQTQASACTSCSDDVLDASPPDRARSSAARPSRRRRRTAARRTSGRACRARASSRRGCRPAPARRGARGAKTSRRSLGVAAVGDVEHAGEAGARVVRALVPLAQDRRVLGDAGAVVVLRVEPLRRAAGAAAPGSRRARCAHAARRFAALPRRARATARAARARGFFGVGSIALRRIDQRVGHPQRDPLDLAVGQAPDVLQDHVRLDAVDDRERAVQPVADRGRQRLGERRERVLEDARRGGRAGTAPPRAGRRARAPTARARAAPRRASAARIP